MCSLRAAVVVAGLSLAAAQPAAAQWQTYCSPTTPGACVGIEFAGSGAGTALFIRNLQGSIGPSSGGYFDLQYLEISVRNGLIRVTDPNFEEEEGALRPEGCLSDVVGAVAVGNDCFRGGYGDVTWIGERTFVNVFSAHTFINYGVFGCDRIDTEDFVAQTCRPAGLTGAVVLPLPFDLYNANGDRLRRLTPHDISVFVVGHTQEGEAFAHTFTATPEPATLALLGGGLALLGVGGIARRRAVSSG